MIKLTEIGAIANMDYHYSAQQGDMICFNYIPGRKRDVVLHLFITLNEGLIEFYVSGYTNQPSRAQHEYFYAIYPLVEEEPYKIDHRMSFQYVEECVYISVFSAKPSTFSFIILEKNPPQRIIRMPSVPKETVQKEEFRLGNMELQEKITAIKKKRGAFNKATILQNILRAANYCEYKESIQQNRSKKNMRIQSVLDAKEEINQNFLEQKIFLANRREIERKRKLDEEMKQKQHQKKQMLFSTWITLLKTAQLMQDLSIKFASAVHRYEKGQILVRKTKIIQRSLKFKMFNDSLSERLSLEVLRSVRLTAYLSHNLVEKRSKRITVSLFAENKSFFALYAKMRAFRNRIIRVQKYWAEYRTLKRALLTMMSQAWDRDIENLIGMLNQLFPREKYEEYLSAINTITEELSLIHI
eukprot:TRINITY_DN6830_c0_g1_i7.p1 TRINITY_DN6830_c0_g1~~TRINITY_DN6830_c0_g1_i7.p1  ORF type:complete len:413 (+),score=62.33 TRINITY_DN6830_c0_g1_i7:416-1654(+)